MTRPTLSDTRNWGVRYESDAVKIEVADLMYSGQLWHDGAYRVTIKPGEDDRTGKPRTPKKRLFYGESAWSDAERMASAVDFGART